MMLTPQLLQFDLVIVTDPLRRVSITQCAKCDNEHIADAIELTMRSMMEFLPQVRSWVCTVNKVVQEDNCSTDRADGAVDYI